YETALPVGRVVPFQVGDVQTGHRVTWHRPRGRHGPVAAVNEPGRGDVVGPIVRQAAGLGLRGRGRRLQVRDDLARAVSLVVPDAQDVDMVRSRQGIDLERFGLSGVHAHRCGEAL